MSHAPRETSSQEKQLFGWISHVSRQAPWATDLARVA